MPIDAEARYPDVKAVIPRPGARGTRLRLAPEDASLLLKALPGLPGHDEGYAHLVAALDDQRGW